MYSCHQQGSWQPSYHSASSFFNKGMQHSRGKRRDINSAFHVWTSFYCSISWAYFLTFFCRMSFKTCFSMTKHILGGLHIITSYWRFLIIYKHVLIHILRRPTGKEPVSLCLTHYLPISIKTELLSSQSTSQILWHQCLQNILRAYCSIPLFKGTRISVLSRVDMHS